MTLTLLHSEWPKFHRVLAILIATGLKALRDFNPIALYGVLAVLSAIGLKELHVTFCLKLYNCYNSIAEMRSKKNEIQNAFA